MNIRYFGLALLLGSSVTFATEAVSELSNTHINAESVGETAQPGALSPTLDISDALAEQLDRQLSESTAEQPLPKAQWVSANLTPGN